MVKNEVGEGYIELHGRQDFPSFWSGGGTRRKAMSMRNIGKEGCNINSIIRVSGEEEWSMSSK